MSEFKVAYTKVVSINPHPRENVHSLEIATIYGFQVIIRKDSLKVGDLVLFAPVDSILPQALENVLFPEGSKIKLSNSRIRQIRIQGFPSQGLLLNMQDTQKHLVSLGYKNFLFEEEKDYSELLGIRKFEPPAPSFHSGLPITSKRRLSEHPNMHGYNGLENIKWYPNLFKDDEEVIVQLKLHGTNARMGCLKTEVKTPWKKLLNFFKILPKYHYRYGSNNVDISAKQGNKSGFYGTDIYGESFRLCKAKEKIQPNELIFGEIIGEGIQAGYHYGHKLPNFVLFDVKIFNEDGTWYWLSPEEVQTYAKKRGFEMVPVLFDGKYSKSVLDSLVSGADPYYPQHKVREGIVIKMKGEGYNNPLCSGSKKSLKYINPAYLDKLDNTDFH
jgi:RNA ligase (TIGR02306 family)